MRSSFVLVLYLYVQKISNLMLRIVSIPIIICKHSCDISDYSLVSLTSLEGSRRLYLHLQSHQLPLLLVPHQGVQSRQQPTWSRAGRYWSGRRWVCQGRWRISRGSLGGNGWKIDMPVKAERHQADLAEYENKQPSFNEVLIWGGRYLLKYLRKLFKSLTSA